MASLSSFPFLIDGTMEGSGSARSRVLATIRQGNPLESVSYRCWRLGSFGVGNDSFGSCLLGGGRLVSLFRRTGGSSERIMRLRAVGGDEPEKSSEDVLQETIEKSKRVLAVQRELLQQIAERRKVVASIKSDISNDADGRDSSQANENSSSGPDEAYDIRSLSSDLGSGRSSNGNSSDSTVPDKAYANSSLPSVPSKNPKNPTSGFSSSSGEWKKTTVGGSPPERIEIKQGSSHVEGTSRSSAKAARNYASSDVEDTSRSSAKVAGNYAYSGKGQAKISSNKKSSLDLESTVKAPEITTIPAPSSMTSETSSPINKLEESMAMTLPSDTTESTSEDTKPPPLAGVNVMNVILTAAECSPFSKTGGLGDVAGSLPKVLARRGHRVMVVVPKYGNYPEAKHTGVVKRYMVAGQDVEVSYFQAYIDGVDFVFIDSHMFHGIENNIYGGDRLDVLKRMVLFSKAAVEVPWHVPCGGVCYGDGNLVFIANDWHTSLLPVYLKAYYRENGFMKYTRSVLVIHNIAHQGRGPVDDFQYLDLPEHWMEKFTLYDPVGGDHCNIFAAGLKAADRIVTVSHGYAWELKTQEGGWGLHNIINENDWKLRGIVNGIDTKEWSPQYDVHLQSDGYTNYSLEMLSTGKPQCKAALQKELGLPQREDVPLIAFIGRLDPQKGVDLIAEAVPWMMGQDVQLVMLGTGRPDLEQMLRQLESQYYDKARGWVGFSVKTAHRITAGADILLMPSRFEPCGLNQLYAMNYGTIPVVHAVGGLRDTVLPFNPYNETGCGWTFDRAESGKLIEALGNCLLTYRQHKQSWEGLQRRGMSQDLSWDHAAEIYEEVLVAAKYQW